MEITLTWGDMFNITVLPSTTPEKGCGWGRRFCNGEGTRESEHNPRSAGRSSPEISLSAHVFEDGASPATWKHCAGSMLSMANADQASPRGNAKRRFRWESALFFYFAFVSQMERR